MRKADPDEVVRLWVDEGLNVVEIAEKVGVTHQRVSSILRERNVNGGPKRYRNNPKTVDAELLRKLYVDQGMSASLIAQSLGVGYYTVTGWLDKYGIPVRKPGEANIIFPQLRELKIGESMDVPRIQTTNKKTWTRYYHMAKSAGIRVSLKTIDERTLRLKRVK